MSFEDQFGRGPSRGYQPKSYQNSSPVYESSPNTVQMRNYHPQTYNGGGTTANYETVVRMASDNIRQLSVYVGQIKSLSETLGGTKDTLENRDKLRQMIDSARILSNDTSQVLKNLHDVIQRSSGTEERTRRIQQGKLVKDFQTWLTKFQEISKFAAEKERNTPIPQQQQQQPRSGFSHQKPQSNGYYDDDDIEKQNFMEAQRVQQLQVENERNFMDALIADREQGIKDIEKTVTEVNEIFRDLSHLVQEQGQMIDHIESNIDDSMARTDEGVVELRKANEYQKKSRNKMCCLALILLLLAGGAVLVIYFLVK